MASGRCQGKPKKKIKRHDAQKNNRAGTKQADGHAKL
jgi:hypothetical protein